VRKPWRSGPGRKAISGLSLALVLAASIGGPVAFASATPSSGPDSLGGLPSGAVTHVWLIILADKSYDEAFTGLDKNTYLGQTLPSEGELLQNYYGTGHSSMDNFLSLVSGQAPEEDTQEDCSDVNVPFGSNSTIVTSAADIAAGGTGAVGSATPNWNLGQVASLLNPSQPSGANAPLGASGSTTTNGCTYPSDVPTLFDQFNLAGVSWKGDAQDLGGAQPIGSTSFVSDSVPGRDDGPCGAPGSATENPVTNPTYLTATASHPLPSDVSSYTSDSLVTGTGITDDPQYSDQYVATHFPFPWFESLVGGYDPSTGASQPALTEPDATGGGGTNCDSNHIANLDNPTDGLVHDLRNNTVPAFSWITPDDCSDAHDTTCVGNNLSGAFGLNPDGTVNLNDPIYAPPGLPAYDPEATTPRNFTGGLYASDLFLAYYVPLIEASAAYAHGLIDITFDEGEPSSPQSTAPADAPTFGSHGTTAPGAHSIFGAYGISADAAGENIGGINVATEPYGPNSTLGTNASGNQLYPGPGNNSFIDRPPVCTSTDPDTPEDCVPGVVRGGSGTSPGARTDGASADELSDATDPTPGGGRTGSVLISPYIAPGTKSTTDYNHYSWLRTMEDLFDVSSCAATSTNITLPAGTVCGGLDGLGHIGYAAQVNLAAFGSDVFSAPSGNGFQQIQQIRPANALPESPLVILLPAIGGIMLVSGLLVLRRRRRVSRH
jgi:hypothetical protein